MSNSYDEEEIGYGNPPKSGQFQKGQSGNPAGRPKGSSRLNYHESLKKALEKEVTIHEKGDPITLSMLDLITRRIVTEAGNGKPTAMRLIMEQMNNYHDKLFDRSEEARAKHLVVRYVRGRDEHGNLVYSDTEHLFQRIPGVSPEPEEGENDDSDDN